MVAAAAMVSLLGSAAKALATSKVERNVLSKKDGRTVIRTRTAEAADYDEVSVIVCCLLCLYFSWVRKFFRRSFFRATDSRTWLLVRLQII